MNSILDMWRSIVAHFDTADANVSYKARVNYYRETFNKTL